MKTNTFVGKVVSNRMQKSVLVTIERFVIHPKYKKRMKHTTKLMAHDEKNECQIGDTVRINLCRPLSKNKSFVVAHIMRTAKQYDADAAAAAAAAANAQAVSVQGSGSLISRGFAASAVPSG